MAFAENKEKFLFLLTFIMNVVNDLVENHIRQDVELFQSVWASEVRPQLEELFRTFEAIESEDSPLWREIQNRGFTPTQIKLIQTRLTEATLAGPDTARVHMLTSAVLSEIPGAGFLTWFKIFVQDAVTDRMAPIIPN
ncbi:hypothetical protein [Terriglobus albidus]|uniref:hypothetical protein n=1 Tax=Terriglobus albidus TaxID=1592106 RepID=UPI0021E0AE16|nr:hypothetical protein [Terriglobus albidus]